MFIIKALLLVIVCAIGGAILGFVVPFGIAQFDNNPAWSFIPMLAMPGGLVFGLIAGVILVFKWLR